MVFFSETMNEVRTGSGVAGFNISLSAKSLQITPALLEFVSPYKLRCGTVENAFTLGFISKKAFPLGVYVRCHGHIEGEKLTRFVLSLERKPKSSPPSRLAQTSDQLGGYPSGFLKFLTTIGDQQTQWHASLKAFVNEMKRGPLKIKITKHKFPKKVGVFRLEQEEIHLENEADKTEVTVSFRPESENAYFLEIESTVDARLNDACFENISEQLWNKANSLFLKK